MGSIAAPEPPLTVGIDGCYVRHPARTRASASASTAQGLRCFHERGLDANDGIPKVIY